MPDLLTDRHLFKRIATAAVSICCIAVSVTPGRAATLDPLQLESNEGYYQLTWAADVPVRLVEATSSDFQTSETIYSGSDSGHVVSGKPNGTWYYRLEAANGTGVLSDASVVTVRHHSLGRAWMFFTIGAIVFIATLALILLAKPEHDERG